MEHNLHAADHDGSVHTICDRGVLHAEDRDNVSRLTAHDPLILSGASHGNYSDDSCACDLLFRSAVQDEWYVLYGKYRWCRDNLLWLLNWVFSDVLHGLLGARDPPWGLRWHEGTHFAWTLGSWRPHSKLHAGFDGAAPGAHCRSRIELRVV